MLFNTLSFFLINKFLKKLKEMELPDVIGSGNIHRCREIQPFETTVYSLQADKLERFAAISKVELTMTVDAKSDEEKRKKKKQFSSLELPVDFTKESVAKVRECSRHHRPRPKQRARPIKLLSTQCHSCLGTSPYKSFLLVSVSVSVNAPLESIQLTETETQRH